MIYSQISDRLDREAGVTADKHQVLKGRMEVLNEQHHHATMQNENFQTEAETVAGALDVLRAYASLQEETVRNKVEAIVTSGLRAVFERDDISFGFRFELMRGQMTATPIIRTSAGEEVVETEAADARGGGVLDVASFLLRCVMLVLYRPKLERILILDETFKHLSRDRLARASHLVKQMSEKLGIQIILVSHKDEFSDSADKVFDVSIKRGVTKIEERV